MLLCTELAAAVVVSAPTLPCHATMWFSTFLKEHEYGGDLDPVLQESRRHAAACVHAFQHLHCESSFFEQVFNLLVRKAVGWSVLPCDCFCFFSFWFFSILQSHEQHLSFRFHDVLDDVGICISQFGFDGHHGTSVPHCVHRGCALSMLSHVQGQGVCPWPLGLRFVEGGEIFQRQQIAFEDGDVSTGVHTFDTFASNRLDCSWQSVLLKELVDGKGCDLHAKHVATLDGKPRHVFGFSTERHQNSRMLPFACFLFLWIASQQIVHVCDEFGMDGFHVKGGPSFFPTILPTTQGLSMCIAIDVRSIGCTVLVVQRGLAAVIVRVRCTACDDGCCQSCAGDPPRRRPTWCSAMAVLSTVSMRGIRSTCVVATRSRPCAHHASRLVEAARAHGRVDAIRSLLHNCRDLSHAIANSKRVGCADHIERRTKTKNTNP